MIEKLLADFEATKRLTAGAISPPREIEYGQIYQSLVKLGVVPQIKRKYRNITGRVNWASAQHKARNENGKRKDRVSARYRGR